jgi:transcriptional regulator with XRE-family HTH domain
MRRSIHTDPGWVAFAEELGRNIQRERLARGLSQELIAHTVGLSRYTYQKYEKGESKPGTPANPSLQTVLAITQAIGIPLASVLPEGIPDLRAK